MSEPLVEMEYLEYENDSVTAVRRPVIAESVWALRVNGAAWATLACTPQDVHYLALGHALAGGALRGLDELTAIDVMPSAGQTWRFTPGHGIDQLHTSDERTPGGSIDVWIRRDGPPPAPAEPLPVAAQAQPPLIADLRIAPAQILELMREMNYQAALYRQARGVHTSALSDGTRLLAQVEDIGRYNTIDKLRGLCEAQRLASARMLLLTTGRLSSLMLLKARLMDIPVVISRTSPTAAAVQLAQHWGMTLVGYARAPRLRIYAGAQRIDLGADEAGS